MSDNSLLRDFIAETGEHLEETERNLLHLEQEPGNAKLLNEIFRSVHTIKGSSEYLGMERIAELSHCLESLLDLLRRGERHTDSAVVDLLIAANDRLGVLVADLSQHQQERAAIDDLIEQIDAIAGKVEPLSAEAVLPDSAVESDASDSETYEDEYDEELFGIFADQLKDGLQALAREAGQMQADRDLEAVWDHCIDRLEALRSSANYMGYEKLKDLYDQWIGSLEQVRGQVASGDPIDIAVFVQEVMAANLDRVKNLFPKLPNLQDVAIPTASGPDSPELPAAEDPAAEFNLENMHAVLNEKFGSIGHTENEPDLLSDTDSSQMPDQVPDQRIDQVPQTDQTDQGLLGDFIIETGEHLEETERNLLRLEQDPGNAELLNEIFRSVHTIKGSSEYLGMERIAELSHRLESLLDLLRRGERHTDSAVVDLLIAANDRIKTLVGDLTQGQQELTAIDDLVLQINSLISEQKLPDTEEVQSENISKPLTGMEEEYDQELFSIFIKQLNNGLRALFENSEKLQSGQPAGSILDDCIEELQKLRSSANYMEYDELRQHYETWIQSVTWVQAEYESGNTIDMAVFVRDVMIPGIDWIQGEFKGVDRSRFEDQTTEMDKPAGDEHNPKSLYSQIEDPQVVASSDDYDGSPEPTMLSQLASAFDAGIGRPEKDKDKVFSEDIEIGLFSDELDEGRLLDSESAGESIHPKESTDIIESLFFTDSRKAKAPRAPVVPRPLADISKPDELLPPAESGAGKRLGPFKFGRRQTDKAGEAIAKQSIRVDAAKIDALLNQVGELVVRRSGFNQLFSEMRDLQIFLKQSQKLDSREFKLVKDMTNKISEATVALGRVTSELQENVMRVRMMPIAQLFSRYPRLVHDLIRNTNKKVNLEIRGEETELDKMVIEQIADPLVHIIRNAVDHGIEDIDERQRKGKSESGTLCLEAYHESNYVVIDISDDGRGIDPDQIKERALAKGFITSQEADEMDDQEIIPLILQPGFSTTDTVTHTSGRGVGMDVVKDHIEKLNGTLDIFSTPGSGVLFRIKIPLTLAIIPALMVSVAGELLTIPLSTVDETLRIDHRDISTIEGLEVYYLRDNAIPLIRLNKVFNIKSPVSKGPDLFVVVVNSGSRQVGLIVDELKGREEVVIKPLEDYLQEKSGFSGATILGDGSISLILDIAQIIQLAMNRHVKKAKAAVV